MYALSLLLASASAADTADVTVTVDPKNVTHQVRSQRGRVRFATALFSLA